MERYQQQQQQQQQQHLLVQSPPPLQAFVSLRLPGLLRPSLLLGISYSSSCVLHFRIPEWGSESWGGFLLPLNVLANRVWILSTFFSSLLEKKFFTRCFGATFSICEWVVLGFKLSWELVFSYRGGLSTICSLWDRLEDFGLPGESVITKWFRLYERGRFVCLFLNPRWVGKCRKTIHARRQWRRENGLEFRVYGEKMRSALIRRTRQRAVHFGSFFCANWSVYWFWVITSDFPVSYWNIWSCKSVAANLTVGKRNFAGQAECLEVVLERVVRMGTSLFLCAIYLISFESCLEKGSLELKEVVITFCCF
jgi:hypothetical protein